MLLSARDLLDGYRVCADSDAVLAFQNSFVQVPSDPPSDPPFPSREGQCCGKTKGSALCSAPRPNGVRRPATSSSAPRRRERRMVPDRFHPSPRPPRCPRRPIPSPPLGSTRAPPSPAGLRGPAEHRGARDSSAPPRGRVGWNDSGLPSAGAAVMIQRFVLPEGELGVSCFSPPLSGLCIRTSSLSMFSESFPPRSTPLVSLFRASEFSTSHHQCVHPGPDPPGATVVFDTGGVLPQSSFFSKPENVQHAIPLFIFLKIFASFCSNAEPTYQGCVAFCAPTDDALTANDRDCRCANNVIGRRDCLRTPLPHLAEGRGGGA